MGATLFEIKEIAESRLSDCCHKEGLKFDSLEKLGVKTVAYAEDVWPVSKKNQSKLISSN